LVWSGVGALVSGVGALVSASAPWCPASGSCPRRFVRDRLVLLTDVLRTAVAGDRAALLLRVAEAAGHHLAAADAADQVVLAVRVHLAAVALLLLAAATRLSASAPQAITAKV